MSAEDRPLSFQALERPRAFEEILRQIEAAISTGELGPGDRLPSERELRDTFGVSRSSVREALRVLEMFGVVAARSGSGAEAGSIVAADAGAGMLSALRMNAALLRIPLQDLIDIRVVLEAYAAGRAAERRDETAVHQMRRLLTAMKEAPSVEVFHSLDTEFHLMLGDLSGNVLLPVLMQALRGAMEREMLAGYDLADDWEPVRRQLIGEHTEVIQRIEAGDPAGAERALRDHILNFYPTVLDEGAR